MKILSTKTGNRRDRLDWLVCAVFAALYFSVPAARAQYYFDKWDTGSGLPQNTVGAIRQTRDGYLWLATLDGLVRFDGVKFRIFTVGNTEGFNNNRFRLLHETPDGALWIGSEEFGVMRYRDGRFRAFTESEGLPTNSPHALATDTDGSLLVMTTPGIARFNGERFDKLPVGTSNNTRTCPAQGGGLWLLDESGLRRVRGGAVDEVRLKKALPVKNDYVPVCFEDKAGAVWIAGQFGQILVAGKGGETIRFGAENGLPAAAPVYFIDEDRDGVFWLGTSDGLLRFANNRFERYDTGDGLSDKNLLSFHEDREGNLWFGTSLGGLNRLSHRAISVLTTKDGLAGDGVYPIYEAGDGAIWVGAGGLTRIKGDELTRFTPEKTGVYADVTAIAEDGEGRLWLGTSGGVGFLRDGKFTDFRNNFALPVGTYTVWTIHQDRAGVIWFGTSHGLVKMSAAGDNFEIFTTAQGLPSSDIKVIHEDRRGRLWLATYGGLSVWENGAFKNFTTRDGLSSDRVRSLYEDADGETLWLGTYDGGLNRFRDGKFTAYTTKNGLFSDGVFQILPDEAGYFWMSSNQGIYRVPRQELEDFAAGKIQAVTSEAFGRRDGLLNTECNGGRQPSGVRARDGRLWFPTQEGAAIVNPSIVKTNPLPPPVVIEGVVIDQKSIELGENIRISPNQSNLEIAYTGLSFVKPEQVRFRYKLEGLDEDWVEAGTRRTAYYSHLPPNEYVFRVMAANSSGVWNEAGASIRLTVHPPFWRTWWFVALAVSAVFGLIYFILRQRIVTLERERAAQTAFARNLIAAQEQERKRIAGELHDGLGQNLLVIKNWTLLSLQRNREANDSKPLLEEISETASQTIEEVRRIAYNLRPYQIDEIGLTRAVEGMLARVKATTGIELSWRIDNIDDCFAPENEINLFRIVQECANNIVRHSAATAAKVTIKREPDSVSLTVEDNGKGFAPESLDGGGKRGLGLTGIEERARMLNGAAQIKSAPEKGTTILINIDL
jgi:signal transduction histidine kinase/ligand-binding sensor domain-containing protein